MHGVFYCLSNNVKKMGPRRTLIVLFLVVAVALGQKSDSDVEPVPGIISDDSENENPQPIPAENDPNSEGSSNTTTYGKIDIYGTTVSKGHK